MFQSLFALVAHVQKSKFEKRLIEEDFVFFREIYFSSSLTKLKCVWTEILIWNFFVTLTKVKVRVWYGKLWPIHGPYMGKIWDG